MGTGAAREMVKHPLTPAMLTEMGVLDETPLIGGDFDPASAWRREYKVWTCYGYREQSNRDQGVLRLARSGEGRGLRLAVDQSLVMDPKKDKCEHLLSADVLCRSDQLATPTRWTLNSTFTGGIEGQQPSDMDHSETAELRGDTLRVRIGDRSFDRPASRSFTADWCLFEALGRLPLSDDTALEFDLLEGLTVWKPGQRLSYRGKLAVSWGGERPSLHCFQQLGMGVWPYEFWLDDAHRLVMVITGVRVYILTAEEAGR
jgi:hypothetical protein